MLASFRRFAACLAVGAPMMTAATDLAAHPHVLVDAKAEIVFDDQHRISAVRNVWRFDPAFSAYALQGLDKDGDGNFGKAELASLSQENVESLAAYDYFTYLVAGDRKRAFLPAKNYWLDFDGAQLTLNFTLPLAEPVIVDGIVKVEIFDPEYFVAITLVKDDAVSLDGAPPSCKTSYRPPQELDASTMAALAAIPIGQHDLPADLLDAASALSNLIRLTCPGLARSVPQPSAAVQISEVVASDADGLSPATIPAKGASTRTKSPLSPAAFFALLVALVIGIAVCTVLLLRRLRSAR